MRSIDFLFEQVSIYMKNKGISNFGIVNDLDKFNNSVNLPDLSKMRRGLKHLVFFGNAPFYFFDPDFWQSTDLFLIYVLSRLLKQFLIEIVGLPSSSIKVISRYDILTQKDPEYSFCEANSLVYSGRVVVGKNVELLIGVFNQMQQSKHFKNKNIFLCGPTDLNSLKNEICKYRWNRTPHLLGNLGPQWFNKFDRPALITLSTYRLDDFNVSLAIAQNQGWPVVAPSWNAFHDLQGHEVQLIDAQQLLKKKKENPKQVAAWVANQLVHPSEFRRIFQGGTSQWTSSHRPLRGQDIKKKVLALSVRRRIQLFRYFNTTESTYQELYPEEIKKYEKIFSTAP